MALNILKWLGKLAWGALLLSLAAISVSLFSEGHEVPAFGFGFFATCGVVSWIWGAWSGTVNEIEPNAGPSRLSRGFEAQDHSMYEITGDLAVVAAVAHGEGRVAVVAPTGRRVTNDDDCTFNDPFFNGDPGGMCPAPTGDDRF